MNPVEFKQANCVFRAPPGLDESQVLPISVYRGVIDRGSMEGAAIMVVAWQPTVEEIKRMIDGHPIFLTFVGVLPPHYPSMDFETAIQPTI